MKNIIFIVSILSFSFISLFAVCKADTINITLDPLVTEMNVQPGQSTMTSMIITNNGNVLEKITIQPIDWNTRIDGGITISPVGNDVQHSLSQYLHVLQYTFTVKPDETIRLPVSLDIPTNVSSTPRSLWGGYLVRATDLKNPNLAIGPGATFFVYDDIGAPKRHLAITALSATAKNHVLMVRGSISNDGDGYLRIGGTILVKRGNSVIHEEHIPVGAVFPGNRHIFSQKFYKIQPGTYTVEVRFDYGGPLIVAGDTGVSVP